MLVLDLRPGVALGPFALGVVGVDVHALFEPPSSKTRICASGSLINDVLHIARQNAQTYGCVELKHFNQVGFATRGSAALQ